MNKSQRSAKPKTTAQSSKQVPSAPRAESHVPVYESVPVGNRSRVEEIDTGIYWVGIDVDDPFRCNPYVIVDGDEAVLVDPGGLLYADAMIERIRSIVELSSIRYIIAHHQDPDVCSMLNALRAHVSPQCVVACHSRMSVLIKHFGSGFEFYHVDENDNVLRFGNGRVLTFAHTPYLHSPGAIVTYDKHTRTVFTSDLFGGVTRNWDLYAGKDYLDAITSFHVNYMPSRDILACGIRRIRGLGKIKRIAPQHGSIIEGDLVETMLDGLENLPVGTYADELFAETMREQADAARMKHMVENAEMRFMAADAEGKIVYMNASSKALFRQMERLLPCPVDEMIGKSFDIFHKDIGHQGAIMRNHKTMLPRSQTIQFGDRVLSLDVFAIYDKNGGFMGPGVIWNDITERVRIQERDANIRAQTVTMSEKLAKASQMLKDVSLSMSGAAEETSSQANAVSSFSGKVAENINMVVSSLEEMAQSISEISRSAALASNVAAHAVDAAHRANSIIVKLGNSSVEIGKVIKVISSIAQQTNLLSLNATIEAARAGETGKGFAVVANAVKELAKKTGQSAEDITEKIEAIQNDATNAVKSIEEITGVIGKIKDVSSTIAAAVEEQSVTSSEISKNMAMAAHGMSSITENVSAVAEAASQTSKGAGDTLHSAVGLTELSSSLEEVVRQF